MMRIRLAELSDASAIEIVEAEVWPNQSVDIQRIEGVIEDMDHVTHIAVEDGAIVGFVDAFVTRSDVGILRWEVDLLAVRPDFQRRGIATQLIQASGQSGRESKAKLARALIRANNMRSMRAFAGCGYTAQGGQCGLFISSSGPSQVQQRADDRSHLVWVRTINYNGLWVEGKLSAIGFQTANATRERHNLDLVGVVIPLRETTAIQAACSAGYQQVGQYQSWIAGIN